MKISELIKRTGVHKETIRYYINQGLLPKPRKLGRNTAEYGEEHVEGLHLIKELQEQYFLPLTVIKRIIKRTNESKNNRLLLDIQSEFFRPLDQLLPKDIKGEEAFLEAIKIPQERLEVFEKAGLITPTLKDGEKVYSQDDLKLGKVFGAMRRAGMAFERGWKRDTVLHYYQETRKALETGHQWWVEDSFKFLSREEFDQLMIGGHEIMAIFYYYMVRKMAQDMSRLCREKWDELEARQKEQSQDDPEK